MWDVLDQANAEDEDSATVTCDQCGRVVELRKNIQ
jgi:hypothetical protein